MTIEADPQPTHEPRSFARRASEILSFNARRNILAILLAVTIIFAIYPVQWRGTRARYRMGDLSVFLHAAWAVRAGDDPYLTSENVDKLTSGDDPGKLHYVYPPLLAILMTPLAEKPSQSPAFALPYWATMQIWYWIGVLAAVWAAVELAKAIRPPNQSTGIWAPNSNLRWWVLLIPALICIVPIGSTLSKGQVNLIVLAFLCLSIASAIRHKSISAGLWLSIAIAIKIIPAIFLLYPLWRRDWKFLAAAAAGLFLGLFLIPALVFGFHRSNALNLEFIHKVISPAVEREGDDSRAQELIGMGATDNQSIMQIVHNLRNAHRKDDTSQPDALTQSIHWSVSLALIALTLWAARWRKNDSPQSALLFFGALTGIMLLMSPVTHMHYFAFSLILVAALIAVAVHRGEWLPDGIGEWAIVAFATAQLVTRFGGFFTPTRIFGLAMFTGLFLTIAGIIELRKQTPAPQSPNDPKISTTPQSTTSHPSPSESAIPSSSTP